MLTSTLQRIVAILDKLDVPHALIGGLAVSVRGAVRATKDLDLLIGSSLAEAAALAESLRREGLRAEFRRGDIEDPVPGLIRAELEGETSPIRCDLLFATAPWHREAVEKASDVIMEGVRIRVVQAQDLFMLKLHAGGVMDLYDAAKLYELQPDDERKRWAERASKMKKSKRLAEALGFLERRG